MEEFLSVYWFVMDLQRAKKTPSARLEQTEKAAHCRYAQTLGNA
jgi:hypothetical protein